jgi:hypothetical protein
VGRHLSGPRIELQSEMQGRQESNDTVTDNTDMHGNSKVMIMLIKKHIENVILHQRAGISEISIVLRYPDNRNQTKNH